MKKTITIIVAAAGIMAAFAETSTSTGASGAVTPEIKYPWASRVSVGLTLTSGNVNSVLVAAALGTARKTPVNEYSFGVDGTYGKSDSVKNAETLHAFGQINHLFSDRLFGYTRMDYLHDGIADLRYQISLTPGAGYYLIKETNTTLAVETGPGVVFRDRGGAHEIFATLRLAERYEHKFASGARVWQALELLPEVDKWQNYIANFQIGAEAAVAKNLALQVTLDDAYNSEPAVNRKRNDVKLVSGITYKF